MCAVDFFGNFHFHLQSVVQSFYDLGQCMLHIRSNNVFYTVGTQYPEKYDDNGDHESVDQGRCNLDKVCCTLVLVGRQHLPIFFLMLLLQRKSHPCAILLVHLQYDTHDTSLPNNLNRKRTCQQLLSAKLVED